MGIWSAMFGPNPFHTKITLDEFLDISTQLPEPFDFVAKEPWRRVWDRMWSIYDYIKDNKIPLRQADKDVEVAMILKYWIKLYCAYDASDQEARHAYLETFGHNCERSNKDCVTLYKEVMKEIESRRLQTNRDRDARKTPPAKLQKSGPVDEDKA